MKDLDYSCLTPILTHKQTRDSLATAGIQPGSTF